MATPTERLEQQRRDELIAALQRERAGYLRYGRTDRAEQVAATLADLGAPVAKDEIEERPARHAAEQRPARRSKRAE